MAGCSQLAGMWLTFSCEMADILLLLLDCASLELSAFLFLKECHCISRELLKPQNANNDVIVIVFMIMENFAQYAYCIYIFSKNVGKYLETTGSLK